MPISIRLLEDADMESAAEILTSAFQRSGNWVNELRFYRILQPDGYLGAYQDGSLLGMVGSTIYSTFAYVGLMGVHQRFQRRGTGLALMDHLLKWLGEKGMPQVQLDASEAGQSMYEKLGFVAQERVFVLQRQSGVPISDRPRRVEPINNSNLDELVCMDADIFGADRSLVFSSLLETYPGRAFKSTDAQGRMTGYLLRRRRGLVRGSRWRRTKKADPRQLARHYGRGTRRGLAPVARRHPCPRASAIDYRYAQNLGPFFLLPDPSLGVGAAPPARPVVPGLGTDVGVGRVEGVPTLAHGPGGVDPAPE